MDGMQHQALHALRTTTSQYVGLGQSCTFSNGSGLRIPWRLMESLVEAGWASVVTKDKRGPVLLARITLAGVQALEQQKEAV